MLQRIKTNLNNNYLPFFLPGLLIILNPMAMLVNEQTKEALGQYPLIIIVFFVSALLLGLIFRTLKISDKASLLISMHFFFHYQFFGYFNRVTSYQDSDVWILICVALLMHFILLKWVLPKITVNTNLIVFIIFVILFFCFYKFSLIRLSNPEFNPTSPIIIKSKDFVQSTIKRPNIFHIVLEKVSADTLKKLFQNKPALRKSFSGFTFYSNTISNYNFTIGSIASTMQGKILPDGSSALQEYNKSFTDSGSLPSILKRNNYQTFAVDSLIEGTKKDIHYKIDLRNRDIKTHSWWYTNLVQLFTFLHLTQRQFFPIKAHYFTNLEFKKLDYEKEQVNFKYFLNDIDPTLNKSNRYMFMYYSRPHAPFFEKSNCESSFLLTPTSYQQSLECTLKLISMWLKRIKASSDWPNTEIIIHSDHGQDSSIAFSFLMIKNSKLKEPLEFSSKAIELLDVAPTILDLANISIPAHFEGQSLLNDTYKEKNKRTAYVTWSTRSHNRKTISHPNCSGPCTEGTIFEIDKNKNFKSTGKFRLLVDK